MLVTEEEAKTKWCPFIRTSRRTSHDDVDYRDTNRGEDASCDNAHNCIGSACMAWRSVARGGLWVRAVRECLAADMFISAIKAYREGNPGVSLLGAKTFIEDVRAGRAVLPDADADRGFCGLAGKIES